MNAEQTLARLRQFLLATAAVMYLGTVVELIALGHFKEPLQWIPFGLCALGLVVTGLAWRSPQRQVLLGVRWIALVITLGSLFGIYEHLENNFSFYREIHANATALELLTHTLGGASPLLAPGTLALAAILAVAATYEDRILNAQ